MKNLSNRQLGAVVISGILTIFFFIYAIYAFVETRNSQIDGNVIAFLIVWLGKLLFIVWVISVVIITPFFIWGVSALIIGVIRKIAQEINCQVRNAWYVILYKRYEQMTSKSICPKCKHNIQQVGEYAYSKTSRVKREIDDLSKYNTSGLGYTGGCSFYEIVGEKTLYTIKVLSCELCHRRWKLRSIT